MGPNFFKGVGQKKLAIVWITFVDHFDAHLFFKAGASGAGFIDYIHSQIVADFFGGLLTPTPKNIREMYHTFVPHFVVHVVHKLKCGTKCGTRSHG